LIGDNVEYFQIAVQNKKTKWTSIESSHPTI
jgi:hypothetical protein